MVKKIFYGLLFIISIPTLIFTQSKSSVQISKDHEILTKYYSSISKFDFNYMRELCSEDFQLVENSGIYSLEEHIGFLKPDSGKIKIEYSLENILSKAENSTVWFTYKKTTKIVTENKEIVLNSRETAIVTLNNNKWQLRQIHSTGIK